MRTKTKNNILIAVIVLALIGLMLYSNGTIKLPFFATTFFGSNIPTGNYIQVPTVYYFDCSPASSPIETTHLTIDGGETILVGCPSNTDQCDLSIESQETGFFTLSRRIWYQMCNSQTGQCSAPETKDAGGWFNKNGKPTVTLYNFQKYNKVTVKYQKGVLGIWSNTNGASRYYTYKPFILWKTSVFSGRNEYITDKQGAIAQGCRFPSSVSLVSSITNSKVSINSQSSTSTSVLEPYKTRNFIDQYIPISVENVNFVNYNGNDGYCLNRQIFSISTISTNSGDYKIVDSNFNTLLSPSVECCPNEKQPNMKCEHFKWVETSGSQCSAFNPCAGINYMPSGSPKELIRYNCLNGYCVSEKKNVECTSSSDCIGNSKGSYCDTSNWNCYSISPPVGQIGTNQSGNALGKCDSCDSFVMSQIFGSFWKSKQCEAQELIDKNPPFIHYPQNNTTCSTSWLKFLAMPIVFLVSLIAGLKFAQSQKKSIKVISIISAIIISLILAYLVYAMFLIGIIVSVISIVLLFIFKAMF